jgi:hypothetical protein
LLSVNPSTLGSGGSAQILLSSVQTKIVPKNINILVINPKGAEYTPSHLQKNVTEFITLTFPTDFVNGSSEFAGNYTVIAL